MQHLSRAGPEHRAPLRVGRDEHPTWIQESGCHLLICSVNINNRTNWYIYRAGVDIRLSNVY